MNSHLVVFFALVFSHLVVVNNQPATSFVKKAFHDIVDVITSGIQASPHIIGGREVVPHSYPYLVHLIGFREDGTRNRCGGSLITPEWVLTAAHCTIQVKSISAQLGCHNVSAEEPERQNIKVVYSINPIYEPTSKDNDIALLRLEKPATLNKYVQTIRLPSLDLKNNFPRTRTPVILTGWGMDSKLITQASPVLRSVETRLISKWRCNEIFGLLGLPIPKTIACADGFGGRGACLGDSGGPMVMTESDGQKTIIGVASLGIGDCGAGYPSVYTRVDQYLELISEYTDITLRQKQPST